jgi:DNA polymerase I-like protein with 3'-5' exonuclease and polymerase domains
MTIQTLEYMSLPVEAEQILKLAWKTPYLAVDTEGSMLGVTLAMVHNNQTLSYYFPTDHPCYYVDEVNVSPDVIKQIQELIESHPCLVMHHAAYDLIVMENYGWNVRWTNFYCTMLMAHRINENLFSYSLDSVSKYYGGNPKNRSDDFNQIVKAFGWDAVPINMMQEYSANDGVITIEAFYKMLPLFVAEGQEREYKGLI